MSTTCDRRAPFYLPALDDAARRKAVAARAARIAEGAQKYRREWRDSTLWEALAQKRGVRLPQWHTPPTPNALKKWFRILGNEAFETVYGCSASRLIALNPTIPLRAFIGVMLEIGSRD